jgi:hypothetical protein
MNSNSETAGAENPEKKRKITIPRGFDVLAPAPATGEEEDDFERIIATTAAAAAVKCMPVIDRFERIRDIFNNINSSNLLYSPNTQTSLARDIYDADVRPKLKAHSDSGATGIRSLDPMIFDTLTFISKHCNPASSSAYGGGATSAAENINLAVVPVITREYEETHGLREAVGSERSCVCGAACVSFKTPSLRVLLCEFLTPDERHNVVGTGVYNRTHRPCLLCLRDAAMFNHMYAAATGQIAVGQFTAQSHRNVVDTVGEYFLDDCLLPGTATLYPIVQNKARGYTKHIRNGKAYIEQTGYARPNRNF